MNNLLNEFHLVKQNLKSLNEREKILKKKIHLLFNHQQTNFLETDSLICTRTVQERKMMIKKNIPVSVWKQYATDIEYPMIKLFKK